MSSKRDILLLKLQSSCSNAFLCRLPSTGKLMAAYRVGDDRCAVRAAYRFCALVLLAIFCLNAPAVYGQLLQKDFDRNSAQARNSPQTKPCCICLWEDGGTDECEQLVQKETCEKAEIKARLLPFPSQRRAPWVNFGKYLKVSCFWSEKRNRCENWNLYGCMQQQDAASTLCNSWTNIKFSEYDKDSQQRACGASNDILVQVFSHGEPVYPREPAIGRQHDMRRDRDIVELCITANPECRNIGIQENSCSILGNLNEAELVAQQIQNLLNNGAQCGCTVRLDAKQRSQIQTPQSVDTFPDDRLVMTINPYYCSTQLQQCKELLGKECFCERRARSPSCWGSDGKKHSIQCNDSGDDKCYYRQIVDYQGGYSFGEPGRN
jgi:hypothetical protein